METCGGWSPPERAAPSGPLDGFPQSTGPTTTATIIQFPGVAGQRVEEGAVKFRCERDTLAEAVATAQRTVASRSGALPVLQDLRISANRNGLELVGSDLEITNRVQVPAEVEEEGVAVVPKLFGEIVRRLEPGPVTVVVSGDEAVITAGRFSTSLRLKPAEDYPRLAPEAAMASPSTPRRSQPRSSRSCGRHRRTTSVRSSPACCSLRTVAVCAWSQPTRIGWPCATSRASACSRRASRSSWRPRASPRCNVSPATARSKSCCASATWCSARRAPK